ncbi:plasmid mobilization protein [Polyangium spumosum]|uniref:Uncharacterized protein n=1 Tax=Polyangium spumosum TaxID=889282 RepID=A0A6N7Q6M2_9BACT|nr:hypothetical protein [Polyangium spumosum]MRG98560.1 hypothetical protein [Polyangium spumosum]
MSFRLTRAEAEALQSAAEEAGIARNEYARRTMLGHLSSRGYAPPAPPRALRRVSPVDAGSREPREPIALRASSAPAPAEAPASRNVVSLDARPPPRSPRRPSSASAAARRSIRTSAPHAAPLADPPLDAAPVLAEAPRREPRELIGEHEPRPDRPGRPASSRAAAAPAEAEEALEVRPASHVLAAPPRVTHEAGLDAPAEADPDHALDAPPASVHELAEVSANEARLDEPPELSEAAAAVLAAARSLAALDPSAAIPAPVLVLEVHVGGMPLEEARAAVLVLITRGELAAEAGDDASGLAPVDASGRTIVAVRLATALEG